jgi:hypothetical protein
LQTFKESKKWIPQAYVAWRAGTSNRLVVPARQTGNRYLGSLKRFTNSGSVDIKLVKREERAHKNAMTNIKDDSLQLFSGNRVECCRHEADEDRSQSS